MVINRAKVAKIILVPAMWSRLAAAHGQVAWRSTEM